MRAVGFASSTPRARTAPHSVSRRRAVELRAQRLDTLIAANGDTAVELRRRVFTAAQLSLDARRRRARRMHCSANIGAGRAFGAPFMVHRPSVYAELLKRKLERYGAACWLVNTGWVGGPFRGTVGGSRSVIRARCSMRRSPVPSTASSSRSTRSSGRCPRPVAPACPPTRLLPGACLGERRGLPFAATAARGALRGQLQAAR